MKTKMTVRSAADWPERAACRGADRSLFAPGDAFDDDEPPYPSRAALAYCDVCPVRAECLAEALADDLQGIWGGTSTYQRDQLRRPRSRVSCPSCTSRELAARGDSEMCLRCGTSWPLPRVV